MKTLNLTRRWEDRPGAVERAKEALLNRGKSKETLKQKVLRLETELAAAREETRWRLVEERPAEEGFVLAWCEGEPIRRIWFSKHLGFEGLGPANSETTHWLPLPRLPAFLEVEAKGG